jgi:carbamoyl-phosphate synthase large subunit
LNQSTILLTGAGGAALPGLIDRLHTGGYRVVAVDADPNAAGLYLADRGYRIPFAGAADFAPVLRRICRAEHVRALVPLVDEELLPAAQLADELGIALIGPRPAFIALSLDKYALMQRLAEVELPTPKSRLLSAGIYGMQFPLILKPRVGRGSRGIKILWSRQELEACVASTRPDTEATLLQNYVQGVEFTVSVVVWRDGQVRAVVPKEVLDKRGITRIAVTRRNDAIDRLCRAIQERLRADGPFNVQLRLDPKDGTPLTFEINPRFSTTVTLTQAAGVDELGSLVDLALGREPASDAWKWSEGVTLIRRSADSFIDVKDYDERRSVIERLP